MKSSPQLIYFDMGNVLLFFDHARACRQMAEVSKVSYDEVWEFVFANEQSIQWQYERGEVSTEQFYAAYCEALNTDVPLEQLLRAASDIFTLNAAIVPLLRKLRGYHRRIGILSNTCPAHWDFICAGSFRLFPGYFDHVALSYELKAMKPEPEAYRAAAELAQVDPREIFYVDDRAENVAGALEAGFVAHRYTTARQLALDLRASGVNLAY